MTDKIDIHHVKKRAIRLLSECSDNDLKQFVTEKQLGKWGEKAGYPQQEKYLRFLPRIKAELGKEWSKLQEDDTTRWYSELDQTNKYTNETKSSYVVVLKAFLRWYCAKRCPELKYDDLAKWMKPFSESVNIPALTKEEVIRMADTNNLKGRAILMTLFDTGARIQEFLNIRLEDVSLIQEKDGDIYFKINLRKEFSKTKGRLITCRICTDALKPYYEDRKRQVKDESEPLFDMSYCGMRKMLQRSKERAGIKKDVSPHIFRHSSATYFKDIVRSSYGLKHRFGWSLGDSVMAARYIDESQQDDEQISQVVKAESLGVIRAENQELKLQIDGMQKQFQEELEKLKQVVRTIHIQDPELIKKGKIFVPDV